MAVKDVKALFLLEKWPKFSSLIKVKNSAVTDKEMLENAYVSWF